MIRTLTKRSSTIFQKTARLIALGGLGLLLSHAARAAVAGPYSFFPLTPCRVVDTRGAVGPQGGPALSANTVRTHLQNLMAKLGVHSTLEAVALSRPHLQQLRPGES